MFDNLPRDTLRIRLINDYSYTDTTPPSFEPTELSINQFTAVVNKWLQHANAPYAGKKKEGLFYSEDYIKYYALGEKQDSIDGLTHPKFWDISTHGCLFIANEGYAPSEALSAFFRGPTFAECATVLQACLYRNVAEDEIKLGDIIYIQGIKNYGDKHLKGAASGWNLICVGKNNDNENLYLGFGPQTFQKLLTYSEIKSVLVKFYNEE